MAVQVWIGEKPEHPQERRAIIALAGNLERLDGLYLILANFSVGGRNIDLVVMKHDGIFIIELKYCDGKVFGDVNGPWFVEGSNGERKRLNPGRKNPYNQVISYYYSLINFLNDSRPRFLSPQKASAVDFRTCRRLVVIAPVIQEGSHLETDWKVDLKGLDELPAFLLAERSSEIELSEEEMLAIPDLLHCTRWSEVNQLLVGGMRLDPQGELVAAPVLIPAEPIATEVITSQPVAAPTHQPIYRQALHWFVSTWAGRAVATLTLVALLLVATLVWVLRPPTLPLADQSGPLAASTSLPAGGADAGGIVPTTTNCIWSGFQPVGRRRGAVSDAWETVGVTGGAQGVAPDVVVTLEEVSFCDSQITMTWSVRNNTNDSTILLPLTTDNLVIRDSLGNFYPITESQSETVQAAPQSRGQGSVAITKSINPNAPTLVVQLKKQPFGEATWLVPISQP